MVAPILTGVLFIQLQVTKQWGNGTGSQTAKFAIPFSSDNTYIVAVTADSYACYVGLTASSKTTISFIGRCASYDNWQLRPYNYVATGW